MMNRRDSNIELLRIICMLMITIHHFLVNTGMHYSCIVGRSALVPGYEWATILNGLCYIGVNCFVLISGYYGIKFKWKGLFNLWLICAFYPIISAVLQHFLYGEMWHVHTTLIRAFHCFSSNMWFINCYVILYLLSPILNYARDKMDKKEYQLVLILLTIASLYFGYWRGGSEFNVDGYTVGQFIYLYFIGGYLRSFVPNGGGQTRWWVFVGYIAGCLCWSVLTILKYHGCDLPHWNVVTYNNPFILGAAICFFLFMRTFEFQNKKINYIAKSVLAVYLFYGISYARLDSWILSWLPSGLHMPMLSAVIGACIVFVCAILVDQLRIIICKPILKLWDLCALK